MLTKWFRSNLNFKHLVVIFATVISIVLPMFLFTDTISSLGNYSSFLNKREYNYSVIVDKDLGTDSYAYFDKKLTFYTQDTLSGGINAVVLMETNDSYTNKDIFSGHRISSLKTNELAVSSNIARRHNLSAGSVIYSKSLVKNSVENYSVCYILPEIYGVSDSDIYDSQGIILLGYDEEILENIQTSYIFFYFDDYSLINTKGANISGPLYSIKTLKANLFKKHLLYFVLTSLIIVLVVSIGFIVLSLFNLGIYKKRKEYGNPNTYAQMRRDSLIYYLIVVTLIACSYLIATVWLQFSLEVLLLAIIIISLCVAIVSFAFYKKIRRS